MILHRSFVTFHNAVTRRAVSSIYQYRTGAGPTKDLGKLLILKTQNNTAIWTHVANIHTDSKAKRSKKQLENKEAMKRFANGTPKPADSKTKKKSSTRPKLPEYTDAEPQHDQDGTVIWPAPAEAMEAAREFIRECAADRKKVLIAPDKDADGLSSGVIIYRTLTTLGLDPELIECHLVQKGSTVHLQAERDAMTVKDPGYLIVLDHGSVSSPPLINHPTSASFSSSSSSSSSAGSQRQCKTLLIDHHLSDSFPQDATVCSACHYPPVATSALLTYEICKTLDPSLPSTLAYLACIGTHGDLGNTLKWQPPFPDMTATFKQYTKKAINDAVSLLNAPRRTATYDVRTAWDALLASSAPQDLLSHKRLLDARAEINDEVEAHTHAPPKFTPDGKVAVLKIKSAAQVHPVIATRWAGYLNSKALEIVMVANYGYLPGKVNFSCRIARGARARDTPVNIIESLKAAADLSTDGLRERMGESFARGHKEASGGIVPVGEFDEFMRLLRIGEKPDKTEEAKNDAPQTKKMKTVEKSPQKNTLGNYFQKAA